MNKLKSSQMFIFTMMIGALLTIFAIVFGILDDFIGGVFGGVFVYLLTKFFNYESETE